MTEHPPTPPSEQFSPQVLPYGVFDTGAGARRVGVAVGDAVLDLAALARHGLLDGRGGVWDAPVLNPFLALGREQWDAARAELADLVAGPRERWAPHAHPLDDVRLHLPFEVADYVDFYSSESHARNVGALFRPGSPPLLPNWKHLPIGYGGRAGTVVVSGTDVTRPSGQRRDSPDAPPVFGPSTRLDIETEIGFVVGAGSRLGAPVPVDAFREHVFGLVLLNDWSARDLQAWEYVPLGPFLSKSFATSISPWVIPLAALEHAWVDTPVQDPQPFGYLRGAASLGLDLDLEVRLNGHVVSRPPFRDIYWSPAQQLAHMTVNGASLRTGDLYGSGTISGWQPDQYGSLLELTANGHQPLTLDDGSTRGFLEDGDLVTITATAPGPDGARLQLGSVSGRIVPAGGR